MFSIVSLLLVLSSFPQPVKKFENNYLDPICSTPHPLKTFIYSTRGELAAPPKINIFAA
jgi:hypothetical protein